MQCNSFLHVSLFNHYCTTDQSKESLQVVEQKLHEAQQQRAQALKHKKAALLERNPLLKEFFIYAAKKKKVMEESTFWETFKEELGRTSKAASHEKGQHVGISSGSSVFTFQFFSISSILTLWKEQVALLFPINFCLTRISHPCFWMYYLCKYIRTFSI